MKDVLFPFETLIEPLTVNLQSPILDGQPAPASVINAEERLVNLYDILGSWRRLELPFAVSANQATLEEFEKKHGMTTLLIVAHCRPTNTRQSLKLARSDNHPGTWRGVMELDRDNFRDRVEIQTVLTGTVQGVPHRPVAYGDTWAIHFDEPASLRLRGTLEVKWESFKHTDHPAARQFPDSTHVVVLGGSMPRIFLNSDFEGLEPLMRDRKDRRGIEKALHDQLRLQIARSVWMALLAESMAAVQVPEEAEEPEWPETPWQTEVLKRIVHDVDPTRSESELLRLLTSDWRTAGGSSEFLPRAEAVVGDLIRANSMLRQFVHHNREEVIT
jgi:hypothetical protein